MSDADTVKRYVIANEGHDVAPKDMRAAIEAAERAREGIAIYLEPRPDGRLRVYSDDLPGLVLSGERDAVLGDLGPAIAGLMAKGEVK